MTLGNHEFDDGVKGLVPFLRNQVQDFARVGHLPSFVPQELVIIISLPNQTVPFVVSNIDTSLTPDLDNLYQPSVVLEVNRSNLFQIPILWSNSVFTVPLRDLFKLYEQNRASAFDGSRQIW